jgi:hypothetical protein
MVWSFRKSPTFSGNGTKLGEHASRADMLCLKRVVGLGESENFSCNPWIKIKLHSCI